jgi:hypothetical protein
LTSDSPLQQLSRTPNDRWKAGHPGPKKSVQSKEPKNKEMKQRGNQTVGYCQTGV